ncbi:MAG: NmrA family NAD(P)-binding protein [Hyphomonadaceae bacterium]|nr:NmrA family NAD(P)-binding protein [Hyphomonadaceae bacterium]
MAIDATLLPILVTGGAGKLARLILEALIARGVPPERLITTTRTPERLAALAARGVEVRQADHDKAETLVSAFRGARRMLLISGTPQAFIAGIRVKQHKAAIAAAVDAGVPHIFYTSAPNAAADTLADAHVDHWRTEEAMKASGAAWTILRHWEWPDWHLEHHWRHAVDHGVFYAGSADGRISHITRPDTAEADAGALLTRDVENRTFDITGPQGLRASDIVDALRGAGAKDLKLVMLEPGELAAKLLQTGVPAEAAPIFAMIANAIRGGCYDGVSPDADIFAGRPRTTMAEWLVEALPRVLARPPAGLWD